MGVHEELDLAQWLYPFIIGKAGCELRHIQKNYGVRVYIPREHSLNYNVVIVGEESGVTRAKAYVEKTVLAAQSAGTGRDRTRVESAGQQQEEEEEDWMKQYMYKRA
eukprot:NODE_6305_length_516_cov_66.143167.p3 GENE.NODE_6305_length_516_cov_66.143167~~NODE_6305_length_516_cov_66.143167.p3  ORF type:complete len:107 (+),score=49.84 NODE_6305_length_516_cov_66.143167:3-323(+)